MDYIVKAYKDWKLHSQFHEIVPDMDDCDYAMFNEKQSIRESARSLKKYGSTCCNHFRSSEATTLVRHDVDKTDTLQGIALKYGVTTEQIRRTNRLFASDSLFLRQFLLVPVDKSSPFYPKPDENNYDAAALQAAEDAIVARMALPPLAATAATAAAVDAFNNTRSSALPTRPYSIAGELLLQVNDEEDPALLNNHNNTNGGVGVGSSSKQSKSLDSVAAMTPEEENRKCINEFLNKIDTTISESRKYVEKSKEMITSQSANDLFASNDFVQRTSVSNLQHNHTKQPSNNNRLPHQQQNQHMRHSSTGSNSDTAQLLNTTQTRRVQNSLKRLEQQQDEFFEL